MIFLRVLKKCIIWYTLHHLPQVKQKRIPQPALPQKEEKKITTLPSILSRGLVIELVLLGFAALIVHLLMYALHPSPGAYADTNHYIEAALAHDLGVYRPYGYSAALVLMKLFSEGTYIVFFSQFLLHFISSVLFLYTIRFIFKPVNTRQRLLFICFSAAVLFAPAKLYLTNYVFSDSLFISFTLLWITSLIWMLYRNNFRIVLFHCLVLYFVLALRYTGLFYPVFSIAVIVFSFRKQWKVLLGLVPVLVVWFFYSNTRTQMRKIYKADIFSAFSGWSMANNALHIIPYTRLEPGHFRNPELRKIHLAVLETPDSVYTHRGITDAYMWDPEMPLKKYFSRYIEDHEGQYLSAWAQASIPMGEYGKVLILKYPFAFTRHFLLPNARLVFFPQGTEVLEHAELIKAKNNGWFALDEDDLEIPGSDPFKTYYFPAMPTLVFALWLMLGASLVILVTRFNGNPVQKRTLLLMFCFLLAYLLFHIFAITVVVRYLLGIQALQVAFVYVALWFLMRPGKEERPDSYQDKI